MAKFSQGLAPEVAKGTLSRVLKFGGFPVAHRLLYDRAPAAGSAASRAAAGALATFPEMARCTPLETGKLALQLDALKAAPAFDNQLQKAAAALTAAAGPAALYAGYCALQCRQAVWTAVYFASRPAFAEAFVALPGATFCAGLGAGVLGAVANCPFDVCRSVAQKELIGAWVSGGETMKRAPGLAHAVAAGRSVVAARGARGRWERRETRHQGERRAGREVHHGRRRCGWVLRLRRHQGRRGTMRRVGGRQARRVLRRVRV